MTNSLSVVTMIFSYTLIFLLQKLLSFEQLGPSSQIHLLKYLNMLRSKGVSIFMVTLIIRAQLFKT